MSQLLHLYLVLFVALSVIEFDQRIRINSEPLRFFQEEDCSPAATETRIYYCRSETELGFTGYCSIFGVVDEEVFPVIDDQVLIRIEIYDPGMVDSIMSFLGSDANTVYFWFGTFALR